MCTQRERKKQGTFSGFACSCNVLRIDSLPFSLHRLHRSWRREGLIVLYLGLQTFDLLLLINHYLNEKQAGCKWYLPGDLCALNYQIWHRVTTQCQHRYEILCYLPLSLRIPQNWQCVLNLQLHKRNISPTTLYTGLKYQWSVYIPLRKGRSGWTDWFHVAKKNMAHLIMIYRISPIWLNLYNTISYKAIKKHFQNHKC